MATVIQAQIISATINSSGTASGTAETVIYTAGTGKYAKVTVVMADGVIYVNGVAALTGTPATLTGIDVGEGGTVGVSKSVSGGSAVAYTISGTEYQNTNYP